ncbi:MAG: YARHG domain-containing protein [Clostridiales bacterium]|nr:YARHG domain-containing protein [Clostridiales bacterium]
MSYKLCKISALLLTTLAIADFCSGCANSNIYDKLEDTFQKTSDSSNVLDTYVDDVLTPEYGSVSENDYNSDIPTGVMTSCIRDFDNDGSDELLVLMLEADENSYGTSHNHVSLRMYEAEDGEAVLTDKYSALENVFFGLYEISGIFLTDYNGQIYICGSYSDADSRWSDGDIWNSFVLTYEKETFVSKYEIERSSADAPSDSYYYTLSEMTEFLDEIGLENESKYFGVDIPSFRMADEEEELLMMVVGSPDGKLDHYNHTFNNHVYTLSYSEIVEYKSYENDEEYLCPFSTFYLINEEDMEILESINSANLPSGKSLAQMMINEIYAIHGYSFSDSSMQNYFEQKSWYYTTYNSDMEEISETLSALEKENIEYLTTLTSETSSSETSEGKTETSFSFSDLSGYTFNFSSGAGAWRTQLVVYADGTFAGAYSDWNAGSIGVTDDGTEWNSEYYWCCFNGKFSNLKQINNTTWSAEVEYLKQDGQTGDEDIWGNVLYICSDPYGLDDVETVYFYLPESTVIDLPEEYVNWAHLAGATESDSDIQLGSYGLYNVNGQQGFSSSYGATDYSDLVYYDERISTENDYILPESSTKVYTADELSVLTADQLRIARNEIYARHHYIFDDEDLQEYFYSCVWYFGMIPSDEFDSSVLSDIEKKNIEVINNAESK